MNLHKFKLLFLGVAIIFMGKQVVFSTLRSNLTNILIITETKGNNYYNGSFSILETLDLINNETQLFNSLLNYGFLCLDINDSDCVTEIEERIRIIEANEFSFESREDLRFYFQANEALKKNDTQKAIDAFGRIVSPGQINMFFRQGILSENMILIRFGWDRLTGNIATIKEISPGLVDEACMAADYLYQGGDRTFFNGLLEFNFEGKNNRNTFQLGRLFACLGDIFRKNNQLSLAQEFYFHAIELSPNYGPFQILLGVTLRDNNQFELAESYLLPVTFSQRNDWVAWALFENSILAYRQNKFKQALCQVQLANEAAPEIEDYKTLLDRYADEYCRATNNCTNQQIKLSCERFLLNEYSK